jgi:UDP-N-acetylmuramoylalanine--D-glutamate ligase
MNIDLENKKVSVIGAGRSGMAAAEVIKSLGGIPFVSDSDAAVRNKTKQRLSELNIESEFGEHSSRVFEGDLIVVSPGVPANSGIVKEAKSRGIPSWPEVELAYRICKGKIIGVTGSNGKTTTTTLLGEIFKKAKRQTFVCGNIGHPFISIAARVPADGLAIVELSSFQLEQIEEFRPDIAIFLNISPDHLDRHGDLTAYIAAKMRIFENQKSSDKAVINYDDVTLRERCSHLKGKTAWYSVRKTMGKGVWADPDGDLMAGTIKMMNSSQLKIKGVHNLSNACAATLAALDVGVEIDDIVDVLKLFPGVEHRLEPVRLIGGVSFINDSKGTNVDSVHWALEAVSAPVILIAGGKDKGSDFSSLNDLIKQKVRCVVLIGQATSKIMETWEKITECKTAGNMEEAAEIAFAGAVEGDTVLLSPGCASFDMFDDFEHRGRVFKQAVEKLASGKVHR